MILPEDINRLYYPEIQDRAIEYGQEGDFFCDIIWLPIIAALGGHRGKRSPYVFMLLNFYVFMLIILWV